MYAGPRSFRSADDQMVARLLVFFGLDLAAVSSGWRMRGPARC
jgi:hypothetical protein